MNSWVNLKVDILKVIENFVEMYPYSSAECVVIEAIANCLDAKANRIDANIITDDEGRKIFKVVDNGKGMTKKEFDENYHALSISSKMKGEGIGFAGVGSKLYLVFLSAGESIITETKSESFHGASQITVIGGEPKWTYVDNRTLTSTGTLYEVKLNEEDANFLTKEKIIQIIQEYYNAILLGRYGNIIISFAGRQVQPWKPELFNETAAPIVFKIRGKEFPCYFWQAKDDLNNRQGLEIVVFGKKIKDKQWFDFDYLVKSHLRNKITGQILADGLAPLLTTNKCDFRHQTNPRLWGSFRQKTYDAFGDWLEEIGAIEEHPMGEMDPGLDSVCKKLEREINKLLRDPLFLGYNPFLRPQTRPTLIQSPSGDIGGEEVGGAQKTEGTLGGPGVGHGIEVTGPNEGKGITESESGDKQGVSVMRRVRHGIAINLKEETKNPKESWLTSEAIVINTGHPVFLKCGVLGYPAETQHILRCVFFTLLEYNPPQNFNETLDKLRQFYLRWSTV
jgi:hypothetical protein